MNIIPLPLDSSRKVRVAASWLAQLDSWFGVQTELRRRFDLSAEDALAAKNLAHLLVHRRRT